MAKFVYPQPAPIQPSFMQNLQRTEDNFNRKLAGPTQYDTSWSPAIPAPEPLDPFANGLGVDSADWRDGSNMPNYGQDEINQMIYANQLAEQDAMGGGGGGGGGNGNQPEGMDDLIKQLRQMRIDQAGAMQPQIDHQRNMAGLVAGQGMGLDLTPMTNLVDQWTGSNFTQSYKRPETAMQKMSQMDKMRQGINQSQGMLDKSKIQALQDAIKGQQYKDEMQYKRDLMAAQYQPKGMANTVGQDAADRDYGKKYVEWTGSAGKPVAEKNLKRLKTVRDQIKRSVDRGDFSLPSVTGYLHDVFRTEESIRWRDDVHAAAQGALRATLGAQFTEKEGQRIMAASYNEHISPEENLKKINLAISELEGGARLNDQKASYFENNGTLTGYKSPKTKFVWEDDEAFPDSSASMPEVGSIVDGYKFMGGNAGSQSSWEKVD